MSRRGGSSLSNADGEEKGRNLAETIGELQSLKETDNCTEEEIYATLLDCDMNLNEAAYILRSQGPVHQVKRRREKRKEGKSTSESRPCGAISSLNQGSKNVTDQYVDLGAPAPNVSESQLHENTVDAHAETDSSPSPSVLQPTSELSTWVHVPAHVSSTCIVKTGEPHNDEASNVTTASNLNFQELPEHYQQVHDFAQDKEGKADSSTSYVTTDLKQLNVENIDDEFISSQVYAPVIIPDYLKVLSEDTPNVRCGSGVSAGHSNRSTESMPIETKSKEADHFADFSGLRFGGFDPGMRTPYSHETSTSSHRVTRQEAVHGKVDMPSVGHEDTRPNASAGSYAALSGPGPDMSQENRNSFHSSSPGYTDDLQLLTDAFDQTSSWLQNPAAVSNFALQRRRNVHQSDLPHSRFPAAAQSFLTRYNNAPLSSVDPQRFPGNFVPPRQDLLTEATHHPFPGLIDSPYLPKSNAYMPSAFQQSFPGNHVDHPFSPAMRLPGASTNRGAATSRTTSLRYGIDVMGSQYPEIYDMVVPRQNRSPATWLDEPNSRTMAILPQRTILRNSSLSDAQPKPAAEAIEGSPEAAKFKRQEVRKQKSRP